MEGVEVKALHKNPTLAAPDGTVGAAELEPYLRERGGV
jgi:hypothetical protein